MKNLKLISAILYISFIIPINLYSKEKPYNEEVDSIANLFTQLVNCRNDDKRNDINDYLIAYFGDFLENPKSLNADFSSLKNLSTLQSDDNLLKIFTWNLQFTDGSYKYFGFLQYNKNDLKAYFLNDKKYKPLSSEENEYFGYDYNTNTEWYGALYYELITKKHNSTTYYTLLGWDGADFLINRKVVEVLYFNRHDMPLFGAKIFKLKKTVNPRLIFEYSEKLSMLLRYNAKHDIIVMDHLVPAEEKYRQMHQFYGPDRSYDALRFQNGKWVLESDIDPDIAINYKKDPGIEKIKKRGVSDGF